MLRSMFRMSKQGAAFIVRDIRPSQFLRPQVANPPPYDSVRCPVRDGFMGEGAGTGRLWGGKDASRHICKERVLIGIRSR